MKLLLFWAFQALLWFPWWLWIRRTPRGLSLAEQILQATLFYLGQIILTPLVLAFLGALTPGGLFGLNLALAGGLWVWVIRSGVTLPRPRLAALRPLLGEGWVRGFNLSLLGLLGATLIFVAWHGRLYAPSTYDDLCYRLPISAWMLQNHAYTIQPASLDITDSYPRNMECWFYWILAFFRKDTWVDVGQVPFLAVCMLAIYAIGRRLGSSRPSATAAALLFPFAPVVLAQIMTAYVDVAYTAFLLAALANLLWLGPERSVSSGRSRVSFGLALGLMLGTKYSGVCYGTIFLAAFGLNELGREGGCFKSRAWAGLARRAPAVLAAMLALGGYAYLRNLALHANPLYPYKIPLLGVLTLRGSWDPNGGLGYPQTAGMTTLGRFVRSWGDVGNTAHSDLFGGFGFTWPVLLPLCLVSLALALRSRDWRRLGVASLIVLLFLATPINFRVRYVIFLLGLGGLSFGHLLDLAAGRRAVRNGLLALAFVMCAVAYGQIHRVYFRELAGMNRQGREWVANPCNHAKPKDYRGAYRFAHENAKPGSTVYYFGREEFFPYCLWNKDFSNRVEYAEPAGEEAFLSLARSQPEAMLFLPKYAREYGWFSKNRGHFETLIDEKKAAIGRWKK